jgi:DNA-directed RNA polymerase specialized sigma24 family protein
MVRRTTVFVDPALFESGAVGQATGETDSYFSSSPEDVVRMVMDNFIKQLPPLKRAAVEMCVMSQMTYEEAAEHLSLMRGVKTDKKTVWRWAQAGLEDIKRWLIDSPWVAAITEGRIPVDMLDASISVGLPPWEESNG